LTNAMFSSFIEPHVPFGHVKARFHVSNQQMLHLALIC